MNKITGWAAQFNFLHPNWAAIGWLLIKNFSNTIKITIKTYVVTYFVFILLIKKVWRMYIFKQMLWNILKVLSDGIFRELFQIMNAKITLKKNLYYKPDAKYPSTSVIFVIVCFDIKL